MSHPLRQRRSLHPAGGRRLGTPVDAVGPLGSPVAYLAGCVALALAALITGCAHYRAEPLAPEPRADEFRGRTLADPGLRAFLETNGVTSACPRESWDLTALTLAALYKDRGTFLALAEFQGRANVRAFVLDAFSDQAYGGTGQTVDWTLAAEAARASRVLLAGGLTPDNVAEAIRQVQPYGVDVSSGVEVRPGQKDHAKVQAFIQSARLVSA